MMNLTDRKFGQAAESPVLEQSASRLSRFAPMMRTLIRSLMRPRRALVTLALAMLAGSMQACAPQLSPQESCNFVMSRESQRVSWGPATPVVLYVDSSVPSEFYGAIQAAIMTWNQSLGREVLKIGGWTDSYRTERQDSVNVIYFNREWSATQKQKQAVTTVWWAGDRVYETDISVNGSHYEYFWGSSVIDGRVDFESLILHELGHVLGLEHPQVEAKGTVMARELEKGHLRRTPTPSDVADLKCEY